MSNRALAIDTVAAQLEAFRIRREAEAQAAWERGHAAFTAGDMADAARWLERAGRFSPGDATVRLFLGMVRLRTGSPSAAALFRAVLAVYDVRAAWIGLASALLKAGDAAGAAAALQSALSRHAGIIEPALASLAGDVVAAIGAPGWCALQAGGALHASLKRPELHLDGRLVSPMTASGAGGALPAAWRGAENLEVTYKGRALLGSPLALGRLRAVEGAVERRANGIFGWAWLPADPDTSPVLRVGRRLLVADLEAGLTPSGLAPLARPRRFHLPLAATERGALNITGPDGRHLLGSPLPHRLTASRPAKPPPTALRPARLALQKLATVTVLIPVYGSPARSLACLHSVLHSLPTWARILVVDDASPHADLAAALDRLAALRHIRLLRNPANLGFPAAVNRGLAEIVGDVVLLNSDTLVPSGIPAGAPGVQPHLGWLHRLRAAAWSAPSIGTVTPLSNDATILSYPSVEGGNKVPNQAETNRLDALAADANGARVVPIPTAIGFCMYIRRDCLKAVGLLRADVFAQGYGEENDFCLRAHAAGWRHVAAPGVFVAHVGSASFGAAREHLLARNLTILNQLHARYSERVARHVAADPLNKARRRIDLARWPRRDGGAVLLITHDMGGGVQRQVQTRIDALAAAGDRPVVLRPVLNKPGWCRVDDGRDDGFINLRFRLPQEVRLLRQFLQSTAPMRVELHHLEGHAPELLELCNEMALPYEVYVHDYAWFCARITLIGPQRRYCGEPDLSGCSSCIAQAGRHITDELTPEALVERSTRVLRGATRVVVPSPDVARRMGRHFPGQAITVIPWETQVEAPSKPIEPAPPQYPAAAIPRQTCRVCVVGGIGVEKGFDVVLACAEDAAARNLALEFIVVGYTIDDTKLHATGRVFVTAAYKETELPDLIVQQGADVAFLPSIWPETWCFALSEIWRAGLRAVAFDIGTPAWRIRQTGRGCLLPLGLPPASINNFFCERRWVRDTKTWSI